MKNRLFLLILLSSSILFAKNEGIETGNSLRGHFSNIQKNVSAPLTSDSEFKTVDNKTSFKANLTCNDKINPFLEVTYSGPSDITINVSIDTDLNGSKDKTFSFSGVSGVGTNGVIKCNPNSWKNCKYFLVCFKIKRTSIDGDDTQLLEELKDKLSHFKGARRRFDVLLDDGVQIIDDYAHHPTEILATVKAAKERCTTKLIAIFQPHRYSRVKFLFDRFEGVFDLADEIMLLPTYAAGEKDEFGISMQDLAEKIRPGKVKLVHNSDEILDKIKEKNEANVPVYGSWRY